MSKDLKVQRHELKYYINRSDYEYCKSLLSNLMKKDSYQKEPSGYFIRSLYFDDLNESGVEEKLAGVERRDKYRLRIYDFDQNWAKLERKRKNGNYVQKTSAIVSREDALKIIDGDFECLLDAGSEGAKSIYFDFKKKYFRPVVIVDYVRDAFMLEYNDIRITFDKHLRTNDQEFNIFSPDIVTEPLQKDEIIIMEVKFNNCLPSWFTDLFKFESATASAISKYCQSRMRTREFEIV